MHPDHHHLFTYTHLDSWEKLHVLNENDGPAPLWTYTVDGRRWRRAKPTVIPPAPEGHEAKPGEHILRAMTEDDVLLLGSVIGEVVWEQDGRPEDPDIGDYTTVALMGLYRELERGAGFLTTKETSSSEDGSDRDLRDDRDQPEAGDPEGQPAG